MPLHGCIPSRHRRSLSPPHRSLDHPLDCRHCPQVKLYHCFTGIENIMTVIPQISVYPIDPSQIRFLVELISDGLIGAHISQVHMSMDPHVHGPTCPIGPHIYNGQLSTDSHSPFSAKADLLYMKRIICYCMQGLVFEHRQISAGC